MLEEILEHLGWWRYPAIGRFIKSIKRGEFSISNGTLALEMRRGQYFRIAGSVFNDGVYPYPAAGLTDETFTGEVWGLAIPPGLADLTSEINAWATNNPAGAYASESFGGYSYTKTVNAVTGQAATWQDVFRARLNAWRKL